jgi:hypothetical protein
METELERMTRQADDAQELCVEQCMEGRIAELERDLEIVQAHAERNEAAASRFQMSLAERDEEVAELERREALLTAYIVALQAVERGANDFTLYNAQVDALHATRTALADAGFPWPEDQPCPTCGSAVVNLDCWRCVGAENPQS